MAPLLDPTREELERGKDIVRRVAAGDRRAVARAITLIENRHPLANEIIRLLYPKTGHAFRIGMTGPPGVGKSTLISALVRTCRAEHLSVGVISVDASSPFSQGALLGDRIRLADHFLDPQVYIRSMGTRGHLGGLSEATLQASLVLDSAGKDVIFLETVGVGQSEVEIMSLADTVVLALMPGSGDSIQALKAGVMEIPDVIAINKKDHPAAPAMLAEIKSMLTLSGPNQEAWQTPVLTTDGVREEGIAELWSEINRHRRYLTEVGLLERRRQESLKREVFALAARQMERRLVAEAQSNPLLSALLEQLKNREIDPLTAVRSILVDVFHLPEQAD